MRRGIEWSIFATTVIACSSTTGSQSSETRCPERVGEFLPVACAVVRGSVKNSSGTPAVGMGIRVDSFIPMTGYAYSSNARAIPEDGTFEVIVYRQQQLKPRTSPDTASVEIKIYDIPSPAPRDSARAARLVLMHFASLGGRVPVTAVELTLPP